MQLDTGEFEKLIQAVNKRLSEAHTPIPRRPLTAVVEIFRERRVSGPLTSPRRDDLSIPVTPSNLSNHVSHWYKKKYGDLVNVDPSPCRFPVILEGAIFECKVPLMFGEHSIIGSPHRMGNSQIINAVDFITDLPDGVRDSMSIQDAELIKVMFITTLRAANFLKRKHGELLHAAKIDADTSCDQLVSVPPHPSASAWNSLQVAEKALKAYIRLSEDPPHRHKIIELRDRAAALGYTPDTRIAWETFDFSAGVRYDHTTISVDKAVHVNHEAWRIAYNITHQLPISAS